MTKRMQFVAMCQYPGHKEFRFYSEPFMVDSWSDLESTGEKIVQAEWARISPHPAPQVVDYLPGALLYIPRAEQ